MPSKRVGIEPGPDAMPPSIEKLADGVWLHKSYENISPWGLILSQGLLIESEAGVALVDTTWDTAGTEFLIALAESEIGAAPTTAIVTHAHQDKMGGTAVLHDRNIVSLAHAYSNEDAPGRGLTPASGVAIAAEGDPSGELFRLPREKNVLYFYPGPGHTRDNIVVYHPASKILFAGCLVRPGKAKNLGNTADADLGHWAQAVRNVAAEFPEAEIIVPSHGAPGGRELLDHTIALAEAANAH